VLSHLHFIYCFKDGFTPDTKVKVIAATNRPDILDPALVRSGRLDRKIEFPQPNEEARMQILKIHSRKMNVAKDVKLFLLQINLPFSRTPMRY
jgi:ATP-dependent 26S proteasome regulatory subunit